MDSIFRAGTGTDSGKPQAGQEPESPLERVGALPEPLLVYPS